MSREEQIRKIANVIELMYSYNDFKLYQKLAEHLVDHGIGDRNRFEIKKRQIEAGVLPYNTIQPKQYPPQQEE